MIERVDIEHVACPLGCASNDKTLLSGRDLLHDLPGEFAVVKCCSCGLMRTNPRPTAEAMSAYYPDDYGPYQGTRIDPAVGGSVRGLVGRLKPLAKRFVDFKTSPLPSMARGRMLEVGCASGSFLHEMAGRGWDVHGIEFSDSAANAARSLGFDVHAGSLESAPEIDEPYDLIVGWMVLEHLHDPIGCLEKLARWAKPGAYLVLSVPNAASLEFKIFRQRWYALQVPTHLYHFTPRTLERVLAAGGWKMEKVFHQRVLSNLMGSLGHVLREKNFNRIGKLLERIPHNSGVFSYFTYPAALLMSLFGQTGRMSVWARKP